MPVWCCHHDCIRSREYFNTKAELEKHALTHNSADMSKKTALVTGGAQGIGEAISRRLAKEGYIVAVCDVNEKLGNALAAELGNGCMFLKVDVSKADQVKNAVVALVKAHGRLDALVNNAAVECQRVPLGSYSLDEWKRVTSVNLDGAFHVLKYGLEQMVQQPSGGAVVNMCSVGGMRGLPNMAPYVASKWALRGLTEMAALEYAEKNIRVNAIAPAAVNTPMIKSMIQGSPDPAMMEGLFTAGNALKGLVQPSDVADAAYWLLSDQSRYVTGTTMAVDGGCLARIANARANDVLK